MIVSFEELKTYTAIPEWSQAAEDGAVLILEGLQAELEAYLRRPIETETFTERYVIQYPNTVQATTTDWFSTYIPTTGITVYTVDGPVSVPFRNSPVLDISAVGTFCHTSGSVTALERGSGWVQQRWGIDLYGALPGVTYQVSYTAGLAWDKPSALKVFKLLILRAAAREAQNLYDVNVGKQSFEGDAQTALPIGFSAAELDSVRRYRRQRI